MALLFFVVPDVYSANKHEETKTDRAVTNTKVYPLDEAHKDLSFKIFRDQFIEAVRRRDVKRIGEFLDTEFVYGFGGGSREDLLEDLDTKSIHGFYDGSRENLSEDMERRTELWEELDALLALGGYFVGPDEFVAPYTFLMFPEEICSDYYVFLCYVIVGSRVNVRVAPDINSPISFQLSHDVVSVDNGEYVRRNTWLGIVTLDGRKGYVHRKYVRSELDYRMFFRRDHGKWIATGLYAGD